MDKVVILPFWQQGYLFGKLNNSRQRTSFGSEEEDNFIKISVNKSDFDKSHYKNEMLEKFYELVKKINIFRSIGALLAWDRDTENALPEKAIDARADQEEAVYEYMHKMIISPEMGNALENLKKAEGLSPKDKALVRDYSKDYDENKKLSAEFIKRKTKLLSKGYNIWINAKQSNKFEYYRPVLEEIIDIKKEEAALLGYKDSAYNKMLDDFTPGQNTEKLDILFNSLKDEIVPLLKKIQKKTDKQPGLYSYGFMERKLDPQKMEEFSDRIVEDMGFDVTRGRKSKTEHPFATGISSPYDVGIATRNIRKNPDFTDLFELLSSKIHEAGHGLVEQGADESLANTGLTGLPMDVDESQARLWENVVGKSKPFWVHYFPILKKTFPEQLKDVSLDQFYKAINEVNAYRPRTEIDEISYNLHIMLRYEVEKELLSHNGSELKETVKKLPQLWNEKTHKYLGITPLNNDASGVLQDAQWSCGDFGYFPSYTLGNFQAVQFYNQAKKEISDLEQKIEKGDLKTLGNWLREKIYQYGSIYHSDEIVKRVTGESLKTDYFVDYLKKKYSDIYDLERSKSKRINIT